MSPPAKSIRSTAAPRKSKPYNSETLNSPTSNLSFTSSLVPLKKLSNLSSESSEKDVWIYDPYVIEQEIYAIKKEFY